MRARMSPLRLLALACCALLLSATLHAESAWKMHPDQAEQANVPKGTVTQMDWVNPHSWIHLEVKNPDGSVTTWMIEGGTPNTLLRRGFTKNSLKAGTELTVEGYRAKDGTNRANGRDLVLPDGKRLFLGSAGTGAPEDGKEPAEK